MRITASMMARMGLAQLQTNRSTLARTQEQASTGLRINRPSDAPADYQSAQVLKGAMSETDRYLRSVDLARTRLGATETALRDSVDLVVEAKVRALEAANDTNDGAARSAILAQVESIFDQLFDAANSRSADGAYLFSGLTSDVPAFSRTGDFSTAPPPPSVSYDGDGIQASIEIDRGVEIDVALDGSRVFQGGIDIFQTLGTLWSGIEQGDDALIDQAIGELDQAQDQLLVEVTSLGAAGANADRAEERLRLRQEELTARVSRVEDADAIQVYSDLVAQETALQASLEVTSRLLGPSLLEFI